MANQFLGNNHFITIDEAKKMTKKFKEQKDVIVKDEFKGKHLIPHCESFDRIAFDKLLQREDCRGVRIYYGMKDEDQRIHAIIVGFDAEGRDILPVRNETMDGTDPAIIEQGIPCPNSCPSSGSLDTP